MLPSCDGGEFDESKVAKGTISAEPRSPAREELYQPTSDREMLESAGSTTVRKYSSLLP